MLDSIYCNPLPLPDLSRGRYSGQKASDFPQFVDPGSFEALFIGQPCDFREAGDVEVLCHAGAWYLYPSSRGGRSVYRSVDFINWQHFEIDLDGPDGYAPAVCQLNGQFFLSFSLSPLYVANSPLGPFHSLGMITDRTGIPLKAYLDPALFTDDDGRMFVYWGYGPSDGGIFGAEVDVTSLPRLKSDPVFLIDFDPSHKWERFGEYHEFSDRSSVEGVSMFKHGEDYYLTYSANGADFRQYACGYYRGRSPLGPFIYAKNNPLTHQNTGLVTSTGHGGIVCGPGGSLWFFYSTVIRQHHEFERRIGMDKIVLDADGNMSVSISSVPMYLSGNSVGLLPLGVNGRVKVSSYFGFNYGNYAVDDCSHTWWEPLPDDPEPWIEVDFWGEFHTEAVRLIWSESNLDYASGKIPEPVKYRIDFFRRESLHPCGSLDFSCNRIDKIVDFRTFAPVYAQRVRVTIIRGNDKINHGITQMTFFGKQ